MAEPAYYRDADAETTEITRHSTTKAHINGVEYTILTGHKTHNPRVDIEVLWTTKYGDNERAETFNWCHAHDNVTAVRKAKTSRSKVQDGDVLQALKQVGVKAVSWYVNTDRQPVRTKIVASHEIPEK